MLFFIFIKHIFSLFFSLDITNNINLDQNGHQMADLSFQDRDGDGTVRPEKLTELSKKMRKAF